MKNLKSQIQLLQKLFEEYSIAKERLRLTAVDITKHYGQDYIMPKDFDSLVKQAEYILKDKLYEEIRNNNLDIYKKDV